MSDEETNEVEILSLQELGCDGGLFITDPATLAQQLLDIMSKAAADLSGDQTSKEKIKEFTAAAEKNNEAVEEAETAIEAIKELIEKMTPAGCAVLSAKLNSSRDLTDTIVWSKVLGDNLKFPRAQIHFIHRSAREQYKMLHKWNKSRHIVLGKDEVKIPDVPKGISGNFKDNGQPFFVVDGEWDINPLSVARRLNILFYFGESPDSQKVSTTLVKLFEENDEFAGHSIELREMR